MKSLSFFPVLFFLTCFLLPIRVQAQDSTFARTVEVDYNRPQVYEIGGLTVSGIKYLNPDQILSLTGMQIGDKIEIPGEELSSIIKRIWQQRWFSEIAFYIDSVSNGKIYLNLYLQERPRISRLDFEGVKSSERTELIDKIKIKPENEEIRAGITRLNFGIFGMIDWYALRMGITDHEEVMNVPWGRIYKCMEIDNKTMEFRKNLNKIYIDDNRRKN